MPTLPPPASPARPSAVTHAGIGGRRLLGRLIGRGGPARSGSGEDGTHEDNSRPLALVIDDSPIARMLISSILESFEVDVVEAGGSADALDIVAEERPDVVIVDWTLREETAADVLDALERKMPGGLPPVLVVSAAARPPLDLRASATLRKPFTPRELYAALATAVSGEAGAAKA